MKKTMCSMVLGISIAWAGMAAAAPILFYDLQEGGVFDAANGPFSKTWTFDLNNDSLLSAWDGSGYDPYGFPVNINPEDQVTRAWIEISFFDGDNYVDPYINAAGNERNIYKETVDIIADGVNLITNASGIREVDTEFFHRNIGAAFLGDHLLTLTIDALSGDFQVDSVLLGGSFRDVGPINNPVPEPATLLLFITGLASLAAVGRRKVRS